MTLTSERFGKKMLNGGSCDNIQKRVVNMIVECKSARTSL